MAWSILILNIFIIIIDIKIDVVDIIVSAKNEYLKSHPLEKLKTRLLKNLIFGLIPNIVSIFKSKAKSKEFDKKVLYFGGCGSKLKNDKAVVKILNSIKREKTYIFFSFYG